MDNHGKSGANTCPRLTCSHVSGIISHQMCMVTYTLVLNTKYISRSLYNKDDASMRLTYQLYTNVESWYGNDG